MKQENKIRKDLLKKFKIRTMNSDAFEVKDEPSTEIPVPSQSTAPPPPPPVMSPESDTDKSGIKTHRAKRAIERIELERKIKEKMKELEEIEKKEEEKEISIEEPEEPKIDKEEQERKRKMEEEKQKEIEEMNKEQELQEKARQERIKKEKEAIIIEEEKKELNKEIQRISSQKSPIEKELEELSKNKKEIDKNINNISEREEEIEREQENIEKREREAGEVVNKKEVERKRWEIEEKRRKIEKERWDWEEESNKIEDQIRETKLKEQKLFSKEKEIRERIDEITKRQEEIKSEQDKKLLERRLQNIIESKNPVEEERNILLEQERKINENINDINQREKEIEQEKRDIEKQEKEAGNHGEKKEIERRRWEIEEKRRNVEKERWEQEEELSKLKRKLNTINSDYKKILREEIEIERKLGINTTISKKIDAPEEVVETKPEEKKHSSDHEITKKQDSEPKKETPLKNTEQEKKEPEKNIKPEPQEIKEAIVKEPEQEPKIMNEKLAIQEAIRRLKREVEEKRKLDAQEKVNQQDEVQEIKKTDSENKIIAEENKPKDIYRENTNININKSFPEKALNKEAEIRKRLAEIQQKESSEREDFLRRIEKRGGEEEVSEQESIAPPTPANTRKETEEFFRPTPQKPTTFSKYFSRILAFMVTLSLLAGTLFLIYWYIFLRTPPQEMIFCKKENQEIPVQEWTEERCSPPIVEPEIPIPDSLIRLDYQIDSIKEFGISNEEEIKIYLRQVMQESEDFAKESFVRIIMKDLNNRRTVQLEEFLRSFNVKAINNFYNMLDPEFTLAFFIEEKDNEKIPSIVMVTNITADDPENFVTIMKYWQDTIENDMETFIEFFRSEEINPKEEKFWERVSYPNQDIRCLTSLNNTSDRYICYSITSNNQFVLANSPESVQKTINRL